MPENIRLKYAWGFVSVCMIFVIGIWVISVRSMFHQENSVKDLLKIKEDIKEATENTHSISELLPQQADLEQTNFSSEGVLPTENKDQSINSEQPEEQEDFQKTSDSISTKKSTDYPQ